MKRLSCTILFALSACAPQGYEPVDGPADGAWASFRANPQRTGVSDTATVGDAIEELWRVEDINTTDYGAAKASPAVEAGVVYIGSDDARFGAYDALTGEQLWEVEIADTTQGIHGTPTIGADFVYIGAYNGRLYAFDKESGEEAWHYEMGFQIGASPVLVPEHGRVYNTHERSSSGGGHIVAVDALTGEEAWNFSVRAHPHSSVAVSPANDLLFVGDNLAIVHAIDTTSGKKVWDYQIPQTKDEQSDIKTTPTIVEPHDMVVVSAWSGKVHAFDMFDGTIRWETDFGSNFMGSPAYSPERDLIYVGVPGSVDALVALDAATGAEVWRAPTGANVTSSPALGTDQERVVVGSGKSLFAFDAATGDEIWRHEIGGSVTASPALWRNYVFIAARAGDLVAIETH